MPNETAILDIIENGIFIADNDLTIRFWNNWLATHTGITKDVAQGRRLDDLFSNTSFKLLRRKVKIALKLKSSTFTSSSVDKYVIPIELRKITKSIFRYMRQDVVITPLNDEEVSIIIYDSSPLLEAKAVINDQLLLVQKQACTDSLTSCYNRKMFNDLLTAETKRAERHGTIFSMIIFDVDNFKSVNDTYGHLVGDEVLKTLVTISSKTIRESDNLARWGGEEFTILLPETNLTGAVNVAEKLRSAIAAHDFGEPGHKTCSFGVAQYTLKEKKNTIIYNADLALYHAKNNGKNQVVISDQGELRTWQK